MNLNDSAAVRAVWQRVLQAPTDAAPEAALAERISDERTAHAAYLALARRGGRFAPVFRALARDEACHAQKLSALYFLLTGRKSCVMRGAVATREELCAAVRARYADERSSENAYRTAAERYPEHAALLCALADDERRHAQRLHAVMEALLST